MIYAHGHSCHHLTSYRPQGPRRPVALADWIRGGEEYTAWKTAVTLHEGPFGTRRGHLNRSHTKLLMIQIMRMLLWYRSPWPCLMSNFPQGRTRLPCATSKRAEIIWFSLNTYIDTQPSSPSLAVAWWRYQLATPLSTLRRLPLSLYIICRPPM